MQPITSLAPADRRRTFIVLVAENLATLDGTAAFINGVNVTVCARDATSAPQAIYSAYDFHTRLYRPFFAAIEEKHGYSR